MPTTVKINQLPSASNSDITPASDVLPIIDGDTTKKITVENLLIAAGKVISGNLVPVPNEGEYTSSFSLGSETSAWKDLYVSDGTIFLQKGDGTRSTFNKQDVDDLKAGKSLNKGASQLTNELDDTTYVRMGQAGKAWHYASGKPLIKLQTSSFGLGSTNVPMTLEGSSLVITGSTEISGSCTVSGSFTVTDLLTVLANYGQTGSFSVSGSTTLDGDVNCDGVVNVQDLLTVLGGMDVSGSSTITGSVEISGSIYCTGTVVETFPNSIVISGSRSLTLGTHAFRQVRIASGTFMDSVNDIDNFMQSHSAYYGGSGPSNTLTLNLPSVDCGHAYNIINTFWPGQNGNYMGHNGFGTQPTIVIKPSGSNKFVFGPGGVNMNAGDKLIYHSSSYHTEAAYGTGVNITSVLSGSTYVWVATQINGSWISGSSPLD